MASVSSGMEAAEPAGRVRDVSWTCLRPLSGAALAAPRKKVRPSTLTLTAASSADDSAGGVNSAVPKRKKTEPSR